EPETPALIAANEHPGEAANESAHAGSPFGSLEIGPGNGHEVRPALPIVFPEPMVSRADIPPGVQGDVVVEVTIDAQGNVIGAKKHPLLEAANPTHRRKTLEVHMRRLLVVYAVLATAGMAVGQVTVISGYAGNQGWGSYYPPTPYVPLVTTPIVSLDSSSGLTVGASNATAGNVAGATNSTVSIVSRPTMVPVLAPVFYGTVPVPGESRTAEAQEPASPSPYFETGVSVSEMSIGAARE